MAACFLSAFKNKSLTYNSSDGSPWIFDGILRNFFDNLLMKWELQWIFSVKTCVQVDGKMTQKVSILDGIKFQDFKEIKIAFKLPDCDSYFIWLLDKRVTE